MRIQGAPKELHDLFYNLEVVAPSKMEAKRTVSFGKIFFELDGVFLHGMATDDIISIYGCALVHGAFSGHLYGSEVGVISPENLRPIRTNLLNEFKLGAEVVDIDLPLEEPEEDWVEQFWNGHVFESIEGPAQQLIDPAEFSLSPDKLRKFSLLEPRGKFPLKLNIVEWSDRDVIRWSYGHDYQGVLAILDRQDK